MLNSSVQHDPPRNSQRNSLDCMKSLHILAPIPSHYDFWTVSALYPRYSTFPCWNQKLRSDPDHIQPPPLPITIDDEPKFEISEILDSKIDNCCCTCKLLYLVRWTGFEGTDEETSWILAPELGHTSKLVTDFHSAYSAKPGPLSSIS